MISKVSSFTDAKREQIQKILHQLIGFTGNSTVGQEQPTVEAVNRQQLIMNQSQGPSASATIIDQQQAHHQIMTVPAVNQLMRLRSPPRSFPHMSSTTMLSHQLTLQAPSTAQPQYQYPPNLGNHSYDPHPHESIANPPNQTLPPPQ